MSSSDDKDSSAAFWPEKLNTDEERLKQIIINLIGNALNYTNEGYVQISSQLDEQKRTF
jgi:two-component system, OmpR family, phosphate regulon sensor histidine kinase PhoR